MLKTKQYTTTPERVEAVQATQELAPEIAKWCGGRYTREEHNVAENVGFLRIPTLDGPVDIQFGDYIVKDSATGSFYGMEAYDFESKFSQVGVRNVINIQY